MPKILLERKFNGTGLSWWQAWFEADPNKFEVGRNEFEALGKLMVRWSEDEKIAVIRRK